MKTTGKSSLKRGTLDIRMNNNAGINIIGEPKMKGRAKKNSVYYALFLRCAYFCLCLTGVLLTLNTSFSLHISVGYGAGIIAILALLLTGTFTHKKIYRFVRLIVTALIAAAGLYWHTIVGSSFWALLNQVQRVINSYYGSSLEVRNVAVEGTDAFWILVILFCLLTVLLTGLVVQKGHTGILLQLVIVFLGVQLLCGRSFTFPSLFLVCGSLFGLMTMENRKGIRSLQILYKSGLETGLCILLLSVLIGGWLAPTLFEKIEPWNQKMKSNLQDMADRTAKQFGYNNGKLSEYASATGDILGNFPPNYDGRVDLRVLISEKPRQNVYLKGFVGDTYERTYWSTITGYTFQETFSPDEQDAIQNQFYYYIEERAVQDPFRISLDRLDPLDDYGYIPYAFMVPADGGALADGAYRNTDTPASYTGYVNWSQWAEDGASNRELSAVEEKYQEYVAEQYLKVPAEGLDRLKAYCDQYDFRSVQEVLDFVVPEIQNGREYSLELEAVPEGSDFAEYFFYEQKKGYCIHFATTATLMLRLMGVPARYVTGYVALRDDFVEEDGGYAAELTDRKAHAWVEVYRRGKGWEPVEVTPGFAPGAVQTGQEAESEAEPQEEPEEASQEQVTVQPVQPTQEAEATPEPERDATETSQNIPEEKQEPQDENLPEDTQQNSGIAQSAGLRALYRVLLILLCLAAIVGASVLTLKMRRSRMIQKRYGTLQQKNRNQAAQAISYELTDMLRAAGILADGAGDIEYAGKLEQVFPAFAAGEYVRFVQIIQKAAYGKEQITEKEHAWCLGLYEKAADHLTGQMKGRKKIWWKYWKGYSR